MAIQTVRARGRVSRIRPASTYSGIVSRYANQIMAAQEAKETADIAEQLLLYRAGSITFEELTANVNDLLKGIPTGTLRKVRAEEQLLGAADDEQKRIKAGRRATLEKEKTKLTDKLVEQGINPSERLQIEQAMLKLETPGTQEYNQQQERVINSIENAETYKGEKRRAELLDKYKEGGITLEEELTIYQELRTVVNADSEIARTYAEKEAQVMTSIQEEKEQAARAGAGQAMAAQKEQVANIIDLNIKQNEDEDKKYKNDPITTPGWAVDMARLQNFQEMEKAILSLPEGERGVAEDQNLLVIRENIAIIQQMIDERGRGERFDVLTEPTKDNPTGVQSVTLTEIQNNPGLARQDILSKSKGTLGTDFGAKDELNSAIITVDEGGRKAWIPDSVKGGFRVFESTGDIRQVGGKGKFIPVFKETGGANATRLGVSLNLQKAIESGGLTFEGQKPSGVRAAVEPTLRRREEQKASEQRIAEATALSTTQAQPVNIQRAIESGGLTVPQPGSSQPQPQVQPQPQPVDIQRAMQTGGLTVPQPTVSRSVQPIQRVQIPQASFQPLARQIQRVAAPAIQGIQRTITPIVQSIGRVAQPVVQGVQQAVRGVQGFLGGLFGRR